MLEMCLLMAYFYFERGEITFFYEHLEGRNWHSPCLINIWTELNFFVLILIYLSKLLYESAVSLVVLLFCSPVWDALIEDVLSVSSHLPSA